MNAIASLLRTAIVLTLLILPSLACNTIHGAGEDIEEGGEAIQDVAEDAKE